MSLRKKLVTQRLPARPAFVVGSDELQKGAGERIDSARTDCAAAVPRHGGRRRRRVVGVHVGDVSPAEGSARWGTASTNASAATAMGADSCMT